MLPNDVKSIILHCDDSYPRNHEYHIDCLNEQIRSGIINCSLCRKPINNTDHVRLRRHEAKQNVENARRNLDEARLRIKRLRDSMARAEAELRYLS